MKTKSGTPLARWDARLVTPMASREFAWLIRHEGIWHLELMLRDMQIREVATYVRPKQAMRHVERWIASRWERTVPAHGVEDSRGSQGRYGYVEYKHQMAVETRNICRGYKADLARDPGGLASKRTFR